MTSITQTLFCCLTSLILFSLLLVPISIQAQINLKTGYSISYANPNIVNDILDGFNQTNDDWLDKSFKSMHIMHGMDVGMRYKTYDVVGIELGWSNKFSKSIAEGIDPVNNESYYRKLNYNQNQFMFGLESLVNNRWGFGASIDYNLVNVKLKRATGSSKSKIVKDNNWSSHFFITYHTKPGNGVSLGIRPFVIIPWTKIDYRDLSNELNETNSTEKLEGDFPFFGIAFLFFNGN